MDFRDISLLQLTLCPIRFWEIAIPLMAVLIPMFMLRDIKRLGHYMQKRLMQQSLTKVGVIDKVQLAIAYSVKY